MPTGVYIADLNGGNVVELTGASEPYPIPTIKLAPVNPTSVMRPGLSAAGREVGRPAGAHYQNLIFECAYITAAMKAAIQTKISTYPPVACKVSDDGGATYYIATWGDGDGFDPEKWPADPTRYKAKFRFVIHGPA